MAFQSWALPTDSTCSHSPLLWDAGECSGSRRGGLPYPGESVSLSRQMDSTPTSDPLSAPHAEATSFGVASRNESRCLAMRSISRVRHHRSSEATGCETLGKPAG